MFWLPTSFYQVYATCLIFVLASFPTRELSCLHDDSAEIIADVEVGILGFFLLLGHLPANCSSADRRREGKIAPF